MVYKFPLSIPTFNVENKNWTETTFQDRLSFLDFVDSLIKEPGKYELDESIEYWNEKAKYFKKHKQYEGRKYPELTKDRKKWWDIEKNKCRKGVIYINGDKTFYVPRFYYDWLNFMKIYDKVKSDFDFPDIWDTHYDLSLCLVSTELSYKNLPVLKKRQIGSSLFFLSLIINCFWFEKGSVLKLGASLSSYLGMEDGCWKTIDFYRSFRNTHTDWYRPCTPDKVGNWIQQREAVSSDGKKTMVGRKTSIKATSFEKSPTNGVGGPTTYMFHEEGGIAPRADITFGYMDPAMRSGMIRTGVFVIAGSVGELSQCKPLEKWIKNPGEDFFSRETDLLDEKGTTGRCGLFIPEQWSMPPYIDKYGNSLVQEALKAIHEERAKWRQAIKKGEKTEEEYRQYVSQHPTNIKEAFDWRDISVFPIHIVQRQKDRLQKGEVFIEHLDLERNEKGIPIFKKSNRMPNPFPVNKTAPEKRGCVIVHERPIGITRLGEYYYGTVDPIGTGKTKTSDSLFCVQIWKKPLEKEVQKDGELYMEYSPAKLVASWTGRFDDEDETHEYASMLIEMYNAWTLVESNIKLFIQYMKLKKRAKYLIPSSQIRGFKNDEINVGSDFEFGWRNTGRLFYDVLLRYGIEAVKEVIDEIFDDKGESKRKIYGVEGITDIYLIDEILGYREGVNVDRLICYCAMMSFIKLQTASKGLTKVKENKDLQNNKNLYKLNTRSPFKNIGNSNFKNDNSLYHLKKSNFKNLR
jgi:hypothetical protein